MKNTKNIKNFEQLKKKLQKILKDIYTNEDPHIMTEYRKFFKKHVGFFSRSYVAAYLLKQIVDNNSTFSNTTSRPKVKSTSTNPGNTSQNEIRRISVNIGSNQTTKEELTQYLSQLPNMDGAELTLVKQTPRHTIFTIRQPNIKPLLNSTKNNPFKNRRLYLDFRSKL